MTEEAAKEPDESPAAPAKPVAAGPASGGEIKEDPKVDGPPADAAVVPAPSAADEAAKDPEVIGPQPAAAAPAEPVEAAGQVPETVRPAPAAAAAPTAAGAKSGSGLRDLGRGMELGFWLSTLVSIPTAGLLLGGSVAAIPYSFAASWETAVGLLEFAGSWARNVVGFGVPSTVVIGVAAWIGFGIARRLGRPAGDSAVRSRRRRRWAAVACLGAAGGLVGFVGGTCLARHALRSAEEAAAEADAADPYWRLIDLMTNREEVPDDENSAFVAAEVLADLPETWPPEDEPGKLGPRKAMEVAGDADEDRRLDEAVAGVLRDELASLPDAVDLAREMADYDRGRHEVDLDAGLLDTPLEETKDARNVARLLLADVYVAAEDGDLDRALDSCRAIVATARSIGDEPTLMSQLVREAIDAVAARSVRRVLAQGTPSDAALVAVQALLLDERERPRLRHGLRGERAVLAEVIRRVADGELPLEALGGAKGPDGGPPAAKSLSHLTVVGGWYQFSVLVRWMTEQIAILDRPEHEWHAAVEGWYARHDAFRKTRIGMYTATLPILLLPAVRQAFDAELRTRADLAATALLVAAERHRQKHGAWPASSEALDPEILAGPPPDPYTGRPYRMERADGRLRIYSIGPNGEDEHGSFDPKRWGDASGDDDVGAVGCDPGLRGRAAEGASQ